MFLMKAIGAPLLAAALMTGVPVSAQRRDPAAMQRVRSAIDSLNLNEDQKSKITPILAEQAEKVKAARAEASNDKRGSARKIRDIMAETETKIKPILTDEQWTRFQELQEKARAEQKAKKKNK